MPVKRINGILKFMEVEEGGPPTISSEGQTKNSHDSYAISSTGKSVAALHRTIMRGTPPAISKDTNPKAKWKSAFSLSDTEFINKKKRKFGIKGPRV